ncbi:MAG: phosphoenolpyruvate carboxykinase (ATP) [Candidatus Latescibacterota bacterium]
MFEEYQRAAREIYGRARREGRLLHDLSGGELRRLALEEPEVKETVYGNVVAYSEPMSRAAMLTGNSVDTQFGEFEAQLVEAATRALATQQIVSIDVQVGDGSEGVTARLMVPRCFAHVAYGGLKLFRPVVAGDPTYQVIMFFDEDYEASRSRPLAQKSIDIRIALSPEGRLVKYCRNTNYFGEWKKGVFTGEDWRAKQKGNAIFLHAGCRQDYLEMSHGGYGTQNSLFVALSANGKTSTTCKILARKGKEKSWLIQDDGGTLHRDGSFRGFEAGGLFVKTDALNPRDQQEAYYGCLKPDTLMENVYVDADGDIDFDNVELTSNGRAVIERRDFYHASKEINVGRVDNLFLITRGGIIPAVSKLTIAQATAFMVLGQSMESSAGDPSQAGKIKNEFFYDPFVAGNRAEHANLFYDILRENSHINCFLLNTGGVGEGSNYHDISLQDTMGVLDSVLRGGLEDWIASEATGLTIPRSIRLVDSILLHPEKLFPAAEFAQKQEALRKQRIEVMDRYPDLHPDIRAVFAP